MKRKEFARVAPEEVGISSEAVWKLLDRLEEGHTQLHGIMIMRHGKVCAEGWRYPYAPGLRHGLQSLTKTYAATAVGIAYTEGLLSLEDRIIDLFPEEAPKEPDENLKALRVRDVLCMGCGMEQMPEATEHWIHDFLHLPVKHKPGTAFYYNSMGSSLLGAIVKKLTGLGLQDYLKPRLFDRIGIDADNLRWFYLPDGLEVGGGGLFATTEDNLRLMKLYLDGGVWEGERLLSEEYVRQAISCQNDSSTEALVNPPATDNFVGYGFQIWMCKPEGVYRADGAMGQFAICAPKQDMVISVNETAIGAEGIQITLDYIWEFLQSVELKSNRLTEHPARSRALADRLRHLSFPNPIYTPFPPEMERYHGSFYRMSQGQLMFETYMVQEIIGGSFSQGISEFGFFFKNGSVRMQFIQDEKEYFVDIATNGTRSMNTLMTVGNVVDQVLMSGYYPDENTFRVTAKWPETCFEKTVSFHFLKEQCEISIETMPFTTTIPGGTVKAAEPERALAVVSTAAYNRS